MRTLFTKETCPSCIRAGQVSITVFLHLDLLRRADCPAAAPAAAATWSYSYTPLLLLLQCSATLSTQSSSRLSLDMIFSSVGLTEPSDDQSIYYLVKQ